MQRGRLRVLLGAAPGVGKTYGMLEEGRRLLSEGRDVVVALLETHGRAATAAMAEGLEVIPRRTVEHRGVVLTEMDVSSVLDRRPEIALVDELAHTNAPGTQHEKRWQDVQEMLDAGIDVVSTVNIQHIESLNDVIEQITGVPQREAIPDAVLRGAHQVEVVDLAPQALRDRLDGGDVYPAERIDAALSNYFRLGNLTALRELALLWLADEVDSALNDYRAQHGIKGTWETRERVVVTLTGGPEGETLLRRGARIAARSTGGQLMAVHVVSPDGLRLSHPGALARHRALVESLGGSYHQVVGEDIPRALVDFASSINATQLVLGASRRGRFTAALTGPGVGATVIRESGDIDVHIVTHSAAAGRRSLPRARGSLSGRQRAAGFVLALLGGPALTWILVGLRSDESITTDVLSYQLLVVAVALIGGIWPAVFAALLSGLTLDFFFVQPLYTVTIDEPLHLLALVLYVVIAVLVSFVVDKAARRSRAARRAEAEAQLLATVSGSVLRGEDAVEALVERAREAFGLDGVRVMAGRRVVYGVGDFALDAHISVIELGDRGVLELAGGDLRSSERRLLAVIAIQMEAALEHLDLAETARGLEPLAASDKVRSALLSAVSHDLRRPLAAATAAVGALHATDIALDEHDRDELLDTANQSLEQLSALVTSLLDVSRLQAGVLAVTLDTVYTEDVIMSALDELALGPAGLELDMDPSVPAVLADAGLLQRVVVNLLDNACRFAPEGTRVRISTSRFADIVQIRVVDHGPGIPPDRRGEVFTPFQRLGDTDNLAGLGLGLALSKGFTEGMGGRLEVEDTPGGGLTMVVTLHAVKDGTSEATEQQEGES